jgi:hypothetical protein
VGQRGRKAGATNRKRGGSTGLAAATFPRSVAWRVDQDYADRLNPDERGWLAEFNDAFYGADFRGVPEGRWSTDERREVYRAKNAANRDLMTVDIPHHGVDFPEELVELDDVPLDDGPLENPRYKTARDAYRKDPSPANRVRLNQARRR